MWKEEVVSVQESYEIKRTFIPSWKIEFPTNMSVDICFRLHFTGFLSSGLLPVNEGPDDLVF